MDDFPGLGDTVYDTAVIPGGMWLARDNGDSPILAYDTSGLLVGYVESSTVSSAMGLTIDDDGYLWASNPDDDKIYQIEVTTGIVQDETGSQARSLTVNQNPFNSVAVIQGEGFGPASIEIFDLTGHRLERADFQGSYTWDATDEPCGTYFAVVRDQQGMETVRVTKIR
jgi:hypothetical protein